ncbi:MAG: hypothetical protein WAM60_20880 [Candidatus Promineifilaceae bacterium]
MTFHYRMVRCSHCGAATAYEFGTCRRCGRELKQPKTGRNFLLGFLGAVLIVAFLSLLIYLTRDTTIGVVLAVGIAALSGVVSIISYFWLIIAAFRVSGEWGLACIFIPLAQLFFLYKHTDRALIPVILNIFSIVLLLIASFALPDGAFTLPY